MKSVIKISCLAILAKQVYAINRLVQLSDDLTKYNKEQGVIQENGSVNLPTDANSDNSDQLPNINRMNLLGPGPGMPRPGPGMPSLRTLLEPGREDGTSLNFLNGYGCWCNFDNYKAGRGKPKDIYDQACKRLHDNYLCIEEEFASNGEECYPAEINYVSAMIYVYISDAIFAKIMDLPTKYNKKSRFEDYCRNKNKGNQCAIEACLAEAHFLYDISPYYGYPPGYPNAPSTILSHTMNPGFNVQLDCPVDIHMGRNNNNFNTQCCGSTPNRIRYHTSNKECCSYSEDIFNPLLSCCSTDGVKKLGQC